MEEQTWEADFLLEGSLKHAFDPRAVKLEACDSVLYVRFLHVRFNCSADRVYCLRTNVIVAVLLFAVIFAFSVSMVLCVRMLKLLACDVQ